MPRFAISQHNGGAEGDHFDLFLEAGETLKSWRVARPDFGEPQPAVPVRDHRLTYLEYEGEVSGGRGSVAIWDRGSYSIDRWEESAIQVAVAGGRLKGRLRLRRDPAADAKAAWSVVDPSVALRHSVSAFLRSMTLDPGPEPELDAVGACLLEEEKRLLAEVVRFGRGVPVDWPRVSTDAGLRERLARARARWTHPWIAQAQRFADGLDDLARELRP